MGTAPPVDPREQELISGAPLYNPDVAVHTVQKKQFSDVGKHELALYPATLQANGKFTRHVGSALARAEEACSVIATLWPML